MESFYLLGRGRLFVTKVVSPGSESIKILSAYCVWDSFLSMGDVKFCLIYIFYFVAFCKLCLVMRLAYGIS